MTIKVHVGNGNNESLFSREWKMGSCYGHRKFDDPIAGEDSIRYHGNNTYLDRCCLKPGVYTLVCTNKVSPFGWGNSYIQILGQRYCDDFVGYKGLRRVEVSGKP